MKPTFTMSVPLGCLKKMGNSPYLAVEFNDLKEEQKIERDPVRAVSKLAIDGEIIELRKAIPGNFGNYRAMCAMVDGVKNRGHRPSQWSMCIEEGVFKKYVRVGTN